ncbi:hypothetical protein SRS16CHR_02594 [Variovorax sp. SRS16]|uniref:hypothetical protein n=1 Tax=Variovorax sp. SRS16 TaxID=282217 RepID=UPI0013192413|nr:hypothetical protein [Variovorax sp. SRS16]VTU20197.1 hypothetical protein SRS16CHR_02594 [Variovorax sp. SRS16]
MLRNRSRRLGRGELVAPLRGTLRITEADRATNNFKRNLLVANLWDSYGESRMRGLATLFDPVLLPYKGDGWLIAGTELHSEGQELCEHRQVWLCRPVAL